jgi:hypothetical protein
MLRLYLSKLAPLLSDKAADVRKAAGDALCAVYTNVDPAALLTYVAHSSGPDLVGWAAARRAACMCGWRAALGPCMLLCKLPRAEKRLHGL